MSKSFLGQAWLVLVLGMIFGASLAGMQAMVAERIALNKLNETLSQVPVLVPEADSGEKTSVGETTVYKALKGGKIVGWVVPGSGQGFADKIEILVGCDAQARIVTGLYVLDQKETPGLGNKIVDDEWRSQYEGKATDVTLEVVKRDVAAPQEIRSVTGATISSVAVSEIVNAALNETLRAELARAAGE
ncbi:MAG: FMN-binding protein [Pseudomonadales bacterium]|jgi:electron transport complex protein RnfG|nr:FMN-binding protein [Pseudomonadales bacterium]